MIQRCRIHIKSVRYSVLTSRSKTTRTVRSRNREVTYIRDRYTVGSQHSIGKRCRRTTTRRQSTRRADLDCVASSGKESLGVVVGILSRDLDVEGTTRNLVPDGSTTLSLYYEVIQGTWIHRERVRYSRFCASTQATCAVRGRNREATRVANRHAVGSQETVSKRSRGTCTSG